MPRRAKERVRDILDAVARIQRFTAGMTLEEFRGDARTVQAVEYNLIVIGEAAAHLSTETISAHPEIPWREMRSLRNIVAHGYFMVSVAVVWETINADLPPLVAQLSGLLGELAD